MGQKSTFIPDRDVLKFDGCEKKSLKKLAAERVVRVKFTLERVFDGLVARSVHVIGYRDEKKEPPKVSMRTGKAYHWYLSTMGLLKIKCRTKSNKSPNQEQILSYNCYDEPLVFKDQKPKTVNHELVDKLNEVKPEVLLTVMETKHNGQSRYHVTHLVVCAAIKVNKTSVPQTPEIFSGIKGYIPCWKYDKTFKIL